MVPGSFSFSSDAPLLVEPPCGVCQRDRGLPPEAIVDPFCGRYSCGLSIWCLLLRCWARPWVYEGQAGVAGLNQCGADSEALQANLLRCRSIDDRNERLYCYDNAVGRP